MSSWIRFIAAFVLVVELGCSYRVVGRRGSLGNVERIAIPTFQNRSDEPGYEFQVTQAFLEAFDRRGTLDLVHDPTKADLVISGRVLPIQTSTYSFSSTGLALEQQVRVEVKLDVALHDGTVVPLFPGNLVEMEHYLASADSEVERNNRQQALRRVAATMAERTQDALVERFGP